MVTVAATPFAGLWVLMVASAVDPLTFRVRLDMAAVRSRRLRHTGPGWPVTGLGLAGVGACAAATTWYLVEHPTYARPHPPGTALNLPATTALSLPPATAVVLATILAGCLWLALRPPRPDGPSARACGRARGPSCWPRR